MAHPKGILTRVGPLVVWNQTTDADEDIDLGAGGGAANQVAVGSYHDWGPAPRPFRYMWAMRISGSNNDPIPSAFLGFSARLFVTTSEDSFLWTGPEAPLDLSETTGDKDRLKNLQHIGAATVWSLDGDDFMNGAGVAKITQRYFAPVVFNNTSTNFDRTDDTHEIQFRPIYEQGRS